MTAWQPATQPWRRPAPDVISKLQKGTPTRRDITDLLHCSINDYDSMIGEIERLLNTHGIDENSTIAATSEKQKALQIIAQLKTNSQFIPFLTWAVGQGEDQKNVDLAILGAIHAVHNNRKKREKRRQQKERAVQSPAVDPPPSSQENVTSKANKEAKPLLLQPPQDEEENYKVHVRIGDQQYGILLARTLSAEEKYQMLRADCEKRLADTGSLEEVTGFIELDDSGDETVFDTSKYLEHLLKAAEKKDQKVKLIAKFGKTKRRKFGQITTDMAEADQICPDLVTTRSPSRLPSDQPTDRVIPSIEGSELTSKSAPRKRGHSSDDHNPLEPKRQRLNRSLRQPKITNPSSPPSALKPPSAHKSVLPPISTALLEAGKKKNGNSNSTFDDSKGDEEISQYGDSESGEDAVPEEALDYVPDEYKTAPNPLPSWSAAGSLSGMGQAITEYCYDDDPTQIGDKESEITLRPEELQAEGADGFEADHAGQEQQQVLKESAERMAQKDESTLAEMCVFFKININEARKHDSIFMIQGMRRPLKVYQLYAIYFVLKRESRRIRQDDGTYIASPGLTLLADTPGYGKSAELAGIIVTTAILEKVWLDVTKARESEDSSLRSKHLPKSTEDYRQPKDAQCPSADECSICCPCVDRHPSSKINPTSGTVIFLAPTQLVINSIEEWYKQVDMEKNELEFHIHVQATRESGKKAQMARLQMGDKVETRDIRDLYMEKAQVQQIKNHVDKNGLHGLSRYVFISAPESYKKNMLATGIHDLPCGRFARDEFHQEHSIGNQTMNNIRDLIQKRSTLAPDGILKVVLMSGTPVRLGAKDLIGAASLWSHSLIVANYELKTLCKGYFKMLKGVDGWKQFADQHIDDLFWRTCTPEGLNELTSKWSKHPSECAAQWKKLLSSIMIQRTRGSRWFDGEVLLHLPRMHYRIVRCTIQDSTKSLIDKVIGIRFSNDLHSKRFSSQSATGQKLARAKQKCGFCPGFARVLNDALSKPSETDFEFGVEYMHSNKVFTDKLDNPENPYHKYLKVLTQDCAKMRDLEGILNEQLVRKDYRGRPAKGIIFAKYNETALVVYKYLRDIWSSKVQYEVKPLLVYGQMPKSQRQQAANDFQTGDKFNVIVGVADALGTGLTLTRAQFMVLLEQQGDPGLHEQMIGRILRQSNYNWLGLNIFELYCPDYGPDQSLRERRLGREEFANQLETNEIRRLVEAGREELGGDTNENPVTISDEDEHPEEDNDDTN